MCHELMEYLTSSKCIFLLMFIKRQREAVVIVIDDTAPLGCGDRCQVSRKKHKTSGWNFKIKPNSNMRREISRPGPTSLSGRGLSVMYSDCCCTTCVQEPSPDLPQ